MSTIARSRQFGRAFALAGSVLAVLGLVPWAVFLVGAADAADAALLVLAGVAVVGGAFVALVGVGLVRRVDALRRAADERRLDTAVLAAEAGAVSTAGIPDPLDSAGGASNSADADCGRSCSTCTASCALESLRS